MTTDPKDAEIARYNLTGYDRGTEVAHEGAWVRHSDHATETARLTDELRVYMDAAEAHAVETMRQRDRAEKAEAERDAAVERAAAREAWAAECLLENECLTAERDAALAREASLLASNQSNRNLLYQLTGAQSEVTHMRNRFDTAIAGAYEAAAQVEGYRYNTWGDKLPTKLHYSHQEAIRALTPADALAARDRRDAQMRAEGMRKAAGIQKTPEFGSDWLGMSCAILAAAEKDNA